MTLAWVSPSDQLVSELTMTDARARLAGVGDEARGDAVRSS